MPVRYCVAAVLSLALAIGLPEARAEEPVFDENGTPMYEVNFVDTELGEFIDSVSRITGTTFIVDPRVKGKVTVRTVDLHDADAIYDIFLAQLRAQGYATVDLPNGSVKIVPDQAARLEPVPASPWSMPWAPLSVSCVNLPCTVCWWPCVAPLPKAWAWPAAWRASISSGLAVNAW